MTHTSIRGRPWPRGARRPDLPQHLRTSLAPRRETYVPQARPTIVLGPRARNVPTGRSTCVRPWPRGAKRTCRTLDPRSSLAPRRETSPPHAQPAYVPGPAAPNVPAARATRGHPWPAGAKWLSHTPSPHSSLAPRRETHVPHARSAVVLGPAAQNVSARCPARVRPWPGGAKRTRRRPDPRSSLARRRKTHDLPQHLRTSLAPRRETCSGRVPADRHLDCER